MKSRIKYDLEHKEAKNIQSKPQEEKRIQKNDSIRSLRDYFKHTKIHIIGEEKDQEIGNLFQKIMKENFPNLVKE